MSTVYLALDEVLDRPVAVKLLHREISEEADQLERFRREARAAARLSHPNLVGVIDADLGRTGRTAQGRRGFQGSPSLMLIRVGACTEA